MTLNTGPLGQSDPATFILPTVCGISTEQRPTLKSTHPLRIFMTDEHYF